MTPISVSCFVRLMLVFQLLLLLLLLFTPAI
jgi:hypothetical protein